VDVPPEKEETLRRKPFAQEKTELEEACAVLRGFTLGQPGVTMKDGIAAMERVNTLCDRVKTRFAVGPHAGSAISLVNSARTRVAAAQARLTFLQAKRQSKTVLSGRGETSA
jgi:hypothetical protein